MSQYTCSPCGTLPSSSAYSIARAQRGGSARARMGLAAARNNRLMQRRPSLTPQDVEEGPASMANLGRRMSLSSEAKLQGSLG